MDVKKIIVVGAGPAGMMAAIRASQLHQDVTLIEKNPLPGKKLLLSGKGRCNLTNACDFDSLIKRFSGNNGQFLRDAFKKFSNHDLIRFFESRGLNLNIERQLRVFPASSKSNSILEVLKKELRKDKVKVIYKTALKDIFTQPLRAGAGFMQDNKVNPAPVHRCGVKGLLLSKARVIRAERIILATGGISFSFTGSNGEGIGIAEKLGHRIVSLSPGLVPLETKQNCPKLLAGLTLKNIRLKFSDSEKQIVSDIGELLFTHFGVSGPLVLSSSGKIADWLSENKPRTCAQVRGKNVYLEIDLKPALSQEQLNARLIREFKLNAKKTLKNTLKNLLPQRMVDIFLNIASIPPERKVSQITQVQRKRIIDLLKGFRLDISRSRPIEEAMVTRGGISLKDINPRTMESRLIKGLYFAGEMIDVDADTGGFNLQAAFSTGYLAGESAALN